MPEVNDKAILTQLTGDPQAGLQALLDAYGGMIYAIVRRILPAAPQDAEECAADVLVAAWQNAGQLAARPDRTLQGWLALTARNTAINRYRKLKRTAGCKPLDENLAADWMLEPAPATARTASPSWWPPCRNPTARSFCGDSEIARPCRQIARALGMQEHTVNVRLSRGRARLKQQYLARMDPASRKETAL